MPKILLLQRGARHLNLIADDIGSLYDKIYTQNLSVVFCTLCHRYNKQSFQKTELLVIQQQKNQDLMIIKLKLAATYNLLKTFISVVKIGD